MKKLLFTATISLMALFFSYQVMAQNVGDKAPDFSLSQLGGGDFTLSQAEGKVVFIFFFGNSCAHCLANGPNTQTDIYAKYKDDPNFMAVGIDTWDGNASAVEGYKSSTKIEYSLLLEGSQVVKDYGTTYDRIVIIDTDGIIRYKSTTNADKNTTAVASTVIGTLLEGTSSLLSVSSNVETFLLAPNRVQSQLSINNPFNEAGLAQLQIIDITGKIVIDSRIELSNEAILNIEALSPGYFSVLITKEDQYRVAKFVKVRY